MKISKRGGYGRGGDTRLDYEEAPYAIDGADVKEYGYQEYSGIRDIDDRQGGISSMTVICDHTVSVMKSLSQLSHATIFYMSDSDANDAEVTNATEDRMKKWLIDSSSHT